MVNIADNKQSSHTPSHSHQIHVEKMFIGEKEKWTNKGNDKHEGDGSLTQYK